MHRNNFTRNYFNLEESRRVYDIGQMFTPPKSGNIWEGMWFGGKKQAAPTPGAPANPEQAPDTPSAIGTAQAFDSAENQAARRRLARMSKYFTSPTGTLDSSTGAAGVF